MKAREDEIVDVWVRYVALLGRHPTLLHADAHIGNTYLLPNDDVGFLDWQVVRRGHWSQDVGYFLQGALVEADRRDLVAAYSKELGRGMNAADAWQWYRGSPAYGLAIWLSTLGTDGYQRHDVSLELVAPRCGVRRAGDAGRAHRARVGGPLTMRLLLVRHAQTASNVGRALDTAIPGAALTGLGHEQAARLVTRRERGRREGG
jgi:Phosphotransferase enzyme family